VARSYSKPTCSPPKQPREYQVVVLYINSIANQVMLTEALSAAELTEIYAYDPAALLGVDDDSQNRFSLGLVGRKEK
jgi:hypothetical protein